MTTPSNIVELADKHDGKCPTCHQTIKVYRYGLNATVVSFMRTMADRVRETGVNNIDIGELALAYSVRTQVTKLRCHGLIARVKNAEGVQIARRWLITHKGWKFLNGEPTPATVVVYNNQVLGHDGGTTSVQKIMNEITPPKQYNEEPVKPAEARAFDDVRDSKPMEVSAVYRRKAGGHGLRVGETYELKIQRLQVGKPVVITEPKGITYRDIQAFRKDWEIIN